MSALIFLVIGTSEGNLFSFLSQLAYNSGILSKFACNTRRKPIQWIAMQCLLGYLVYHAFKKPNDKLWLTTSECFSVNGKKPNVWTLRSQTSKIIRDGTILDKKLLDIAKTFKELSESD